MIEFPLFEQKKQQQKMEQQQQQQQQKQHLLQLQHQDQQNPQHGQYQNHQLHQQQQNIQYGYYQNQQLYQQQHLYFQQQPCVHTHDLQYIQFHNNNNNNYIHQFNNIYNSNNNNNSNNHNHNNAYINITNDPLNPHNIVEDGNNIHPVIHQIQVGNGEEINANVPMKINGNDSQDKKVKEKSRKQQILQDKSKKEAKYINLFQKHIDKLRCNDSTLCLSAIEIVDEFRKKKIDKEAYVKTIISTYQPSIGTCKHLFGVGRMKSLSLGRNKDKKSLPVKGCFEEKDFLTNEWKIFIKAIATSEVGTENDPKEVYRKYFSFETLDERYKYIQHLRKKYNVSSKTCCKLFHFRKENWQKILNHT